MTIIHIVISEKFIPPFIELVETNFNAENHFFAFITSEKYEFNLKPSKNIGFFHQEQDFFELKKLLVVSEKIVLHGIWRDKVNSILVEDQKLLDKTYWFMWGAEFYFPEKYDTAHKTVIKNAAFLISGVEGDIDLVREKYGAKGKFIEGMVYAKFNKLKPQPFTKVKKGVDILLGNSGAVSNNHCEAINLMSKKADNIKKIYTPLSYAGSNDYIDKVEKLGNLIFPGRFSAMKDYLNLNTYLNFITHIDIAVFNHDRQQGINNLLILLETGKKIFMRPEITTYRQFKKKGFHIFDINNFDTSPLTLEQVSQNRRLIFDNYSKEKTLDVLKTIFQ
jgi:dTDP-N-acetylfucosamine:lipid II N-acetylfucosaminyltransferase